jgi:putative membrane protein
MKNLAMMTAICLLAAAPAVAQTSMGEKTGINSVIGVAPTTHDFVQEAATSDMFEIQSSQLAIEKGDDRAKAFAQQMITDHQKTTDELKSLIAKDKVDVTPPTALDSASQKKLDTLKSLNDGDFEKQYKSDQVSGHKDAVSLFERYAKSGDNPALKDWAERTLPTLKHHLKMAEDLSSTSNQASDLSTSGK